MKPLFMSSVDKLKQENVLQVVFKQLIVPVNKKYVFFKKWKNIEYIKKNCGNIFLSEKKKISCFKL